MFGVSYSTIDILPLLSVFNHHHSGEHYHFITFNQQSSSSLWCAISLHRLLQSPIIIITWPPPDCLCGRDGVPKLARGPCPGCSFPALFLFLFPFIFSSFSSCPGCSFPSSRSPCHQGGDQVVNCPTRQSLLLFIGSLH